MTVDRALAAYLWHALNSADAHDLREATRYLAQFAGQFGHLDVHDVRSRHIREFVCQPKEGSGGVRSWPLSTRRRAARLVREALAWAAGPHEQGTP